MRQTRRVDLHDQFGSPTWRFLRPTSLCVPTDKNGENPASIRHDATQMIERPFPAASITGRCRLSVVRARRSGALDELSPKVVSV
jgi:hypothetical protein